MSRRTGSASVSGVSRGSRRSGRAIALVAGRARGSGVARASGIAVASRRSRRTTFASSSGVARLSRGSGVSRAARVSGISRIALSRFAWARVLSSAVDGTIVDGRRSGVSDLAVAAVASGGSVDSSSAGWAGGSDLAGAASVSLTFNTAGVLDGVFGEGGRLGSGLLDVEQLFPQVAGARLAEVELNVNVRVEGLHVVEHQREGD